MLESGLSNKVILYSYSLLNSSLLTCKEWVDFLSDYELLSCNYLYEADEFNFPKSFS